LGVIPAFTDERNRIIEQHYLGLGSDKQVENVGNPSMFWQQGRTHCLQLAKNKKKVLQNWRNLWIFSKSSFGVFVGNVCFFVADWRIFKKKIKKKKLVMIFTNL
jgi:hypothetical protein